MGLFTTLGMKFLQMGGYGQKDTSVPQDWFFSGFPGTDSESSVTLNNPNEFLRAYQTINYIAKDTSRIASDIASLEWKIVDSDDREISNSIIFEILRRPADGITGNQWLKMIVLHLLLDGNAFILKDHKNMLTFEQGRFDSLPILNPALVDVMDQDGEITSAGDDKQLDNINRYRLSLAKNRTISLEPDVIHHIKTLGPNNTLRGMGVVQQNAPALDANRIQTIFNNQFFKHGGNTNMVVEMEKAMGPQEFAMFKRQFRGEYGGRDNWSKIMVAPSGAKVKALNLSQRDMEFLEQRKMTREDIDAMFGIPPLISGAFNQVKYDTAREQERVYTTHTLMRLANPIADSLSILIQEIQPNVFFKFVPPQIIDKEKANTIAKDLFDRGVITGNEYREMLGKELSDDPELEKRWITFNYVPLDFAAEPAPVNTENPVKPNEDSKKDLQCGCNSLTKATGKQLQIHRRARRTKDVIEKKIFKEVQKYYKDLESRALAGLEKSWGDIQEKGINIDDVFDFTEEVIEATAAGKRMFTSAITIGLKDVNEIFDIDIDTTTKNPRLVLAVEKVNRDYVAQTLNTRREELRKIIFTAQNEGVSVAEVKGRIEDSFKKLNHGPQEAWKTMRIARTEAANAWDQSAFIGYEELGVTVVDVVGCEDNETDCNKQNIPMNEVAGLVFHPNHTGTIVPRG